ncbi:uncharacterized protein JCM6883_002216 [Sporobolomyces salmoneus]|uniref:uncharacterized protein n=1 Tax=Sporobolomyces salmoneus TaxID=183962 RepID=UPI0031822C1B
MPRKRARGSPQSESDPEDSGYSDPDASSSRSTSKKKTKKKRSPSPVHGEVANRMREAGIGPRSVAWGGEEGLSALAIERYHGGKEKYNPRDEEERKAREVRARKAKPKAVGNQLLCFEPLLPRKPQQLEYPQFKILKTTLPKSAGGKKKKKKDDDSSSSSEEEEDDEDDPNAVNLAKIIGQPDRVIRAVIAAPSPQTPWILDAFGRLPDQTKTKKKKIEKELEKEDSDSDVAKKRRKAANKKPKRTFKDNAGVLILHDLPYKDDSSIHKFKHVVTHCLDDNKTMNSRLLTMIYTEKNTTRLSLRIAISNSSLTKENLVKTENLIWVQDFPELNKKLENNPTHTNFSTAFFQFIGGGMSLPQTPEYQVFVDDLENKFDFTESKVVQPVYSCAGSYQGRYELDCGGGFDSLAKAVKAFEPDYRGAWNIEYITPVSLPITNRFLKFLFAAAQGVTPLEFFQQETESAKKAKKSFKREKIKLGYPTVESVENAVGSNIGKYALRFETPDDLDFDRLPTTDARRRYDPDDETVMHDVILESDRVNNSNLLVILHTDIPPEKKKCEAFVYIGSHSPTLQSWGRYSTGENNDLKLQLANSEFGVLIRLEGDDWSLLLKQIKELIPYKRKALLQYGDDDIPFPTPPVRVPKSKKKTGEAESD